MSERTLVTSFGPFLEVKDNPSIKVAEALDRPYHVLEVAYDAVEDFIFHLDPDSFDRMLLLGVAPRRSHLSAELFARNTYGAAADMQGQTRSGAIQQDQPLLLGTTLFGEDALSDILVHNSQMRLSLDAGTYLCNFTYFKALSTFPSKQIGFLHIPPFDKIPFEDQVEAALALLQGVEVESSAAMLR